MKTKTSSYFYKVLDYISNAQVHIRNKKLFIIEQKMHGRS